MFTDNASIGTNWKADYIRRENIMQVIDKVKDRVSEFDMSKLRSIAGTMGERLMNLKHFIGMMRIENIFKKFTGPYQQSGVVMEDLAAGLSQLGYPLIKSVATKNIAGVDLSGNQLYK